MINYILGYSVIVTQPIWSPILGINGEGTLGIDSSNCVIQEEMFLIGNMYSRWNVIRKVALATEQIINGCSWYSGTNYFKEEAPWARSIIVKLRRPPFLK